MEMKLLKIPSGEGVTGGSSWCSVPRLQMQSCQNPFCLAPPVGGILFMLQKQETRPLTCF